MDAFWVVWNETGHAPMFKHQCEQDARMEAERLARKCPGMRFHVLAAVGSCVKDDVRWDVVEQPLPF
jgi:hypothetical protein